MSELKKLKLSRAACKAALTRIETYTEDPKSKITADLLEVRKEKLGSLMREYESLHIDILALDDQDSEDINLFEERYFLVLSKLNEKLRTLANLDSTHGPHSSKLPSIEIPSFDGKDITKFKPFYELFTAVIEKNHTLSDVQKLCYLRKFLVDEALSTIVNLPLISKSYKEALQLLEKRYDSKSRLICNHINLILDLPSMSKGTAASIRTFISQVQQNLTALSNLNEPVDKWDRLLLCILYKKIDTYTHRAFHLDRNPEVLPTIKELFNFLEKRAMALEDSVPLKGRPVEHRFKPAVRVTNLASHNKETCKYCSKGDHAIFSCPKFKMVPIETRLAFVKDHKLCSLCLRLHTDNVCRYKFKCKFCKESHNTLLHNNDKESVVLCSNSNTSNCNVLLPTVKVYVTDKYGRDTFVRGLLDSGSQTSFVTASLVKKLGIVPDFQPVNIVGIGNKSTNLNQIVNLTVNSCSYKSVQFQVTCYVTDNITTPQPQYQVDISKLALPKNIILSDNNFNIPSDISILLGADIYFNSILEGTCKILNGPVLQNTVFGYVVAGKIGSCKQELNTSLVSNFAISDKSKLESVIERFWQSEKIPEPASKLTDECQRAEAIFQQSVSIKDNKFHVDMPLICPKEELQLGDSFSVAFQRFLTLERKFKQKPSLLEKYKHFINQYVALGHAKEVDINTYDINGGSSYFLAHHAVFNEDSKTTKLRVVFDGSMKSKNKTSLNDVMLNGPVVQSELFDILLRFRTYQYILICDIEKMFRCILINTHHTSLQNILWRDSPNKPMVCLQLQTVTYGLKSSNFLSTRCLIELANRYKDKYPLAAEAMYYNTYVDDILCSFNDFDQISLLKEQLIELLKLGGFSLHKWCSNHPTLLDNIPIENRYFEEVDLNKDSIVKALGLKYNVLADHFYFETPSQCVEQLITKRKILSYIGKIFDPLGIIGPITVVAKIFMQKLWAIKIGWDDALPIDYLKQWEKFITSLKLMGKISIQRSIQCQNFISVELVGFADGCQKAFGCCLYVRVLKNDGSIETHLLCSKSRVAPLAKTLTIPQLELNSALLLAQLISRVSKILSSRFAHTIYQYSDSQIVLAWIQAGNVRNNTYVNNRVQQINNLTDKSSWYYVRSSHNPADIISRGIDPLKLQSNELWWHGPEFLQQTNFSHKQVQYSEPAALFDEASCLVNNTLNSDWDFSLFDKFSSLNKLQCVVAYIYRFYNNSLKKNTIKDNSLTPKELELALFVVIRCIQKKYFAEEILALHNNNKLKSGLAALHPFIDSYGLLRVGGRLHNADIPHNKMHPIILPKNCNITSLIIEREHLRLLHAGPRLVLSSLSQKFWIINSIREVKKVVHKCLRCFRLKAQCARQLMGSLPVERVTATRPFQHIGIDFCGPFNIKVSRIRKPLVTKGYVALFVCFSTKAVHAEVVSDLKTETFLACFDRFIARRGMPSKVFCDNAKTFKGAENKLKELYDLHSSRAHRDSVYNYITFKFIPSYSPEFGGLWEAGVKSVKHHLKRVIGTLCLTYEEFNTVVIQIEGVLNSRPLLSNPNENTYLTPGHFLIGTALSNYPEVDLMEVPINRLKFWKVVSKLKQHFWKAWSADYFTQLQSRPKWKYAFPNLKVGDIVIVKNLNTPPLEWPLAKVVKICPGKDGQVRVAEVEYNNKIYLRSVPKLCPLPIG